MNVGPIAPVFLLGSERSGTNLLRKRLTESQDIYFGPAPAHFLKHLYYRQYYYGELSKDINFLKMICLHCSPYNITKLRYNDYR